MNKIENYKMGNYFTYCHSNMDFKDRIQVRLNC